MDEFERAAMELTGGVGDASVAPYYPGVGGAIVAPRYPGVGAPAVMAPPNAGQGQVNYSTPTYNQGNVSYLGFGATNIAAGASLQSIEISTQRPFEPQHLKIPSTVQDLLINQVLIQGTNFFSNNAGVPVELFSEVATTPPIDWDTIQPSTGLTFVVSNPAASDRTWKGAFWGTSVRR